MTIVRIGNNIHVLWKIYNNTGSKYSLSGKVRKLWLSSAALEKEIDTYQIQYRNELVFTIDAGDLTRYGTYKLVLQLSESDSQTEDATYDLTQLFQIVARTYPGACKESNGEVDVQVTSVLNNVVVERIEGLSAYEIAVNEGYVGSESEWLESLNGVGIASIDQTVIAVDDGSYNEVTFTLTNGETYTIRIRNGSKSAGVTRDDIIFALGYTPVTPAELAAKTDIFFATYNSTTWQEINEAVNAGKAVFLKKDEDIYPLVGDGGVTPKIWEFAFVDTDLYHHRAVCHNDDTWQSTTKSLATVIDLADKQDVISDLSAIRAGAALGATAYQKPSTGIPASDMASGVIPDISGKQDTLVSGSNIKTINGTSILGSGNIVVQTEITMDNVPTSGSNNPVKSGGLYTELAEKIGSQDIDNVVKLTQAQYDALQSKDPRKVYIVTDSTVPSDHVGVAKIEQTTTSTADGGTNVITCTLTNDVTTTFQIKNGNQGNSGYTGAAGELEVVNNLTDGGSTAALSAEMGKTLEGEISQLGLEVDELEEKTETTIVHNRNLADYAIRDDGHYLDGYTRIVIEAGCVSIIFPCKPSTTYTLSKIKTNRFRVAYLPVYPNVLAQGYGRIASDNSTSITITTAADSQYIFAWIYNSAGETQTIEAVMNSLQIEVGETATEYVAPAWSAIDVDARADIVRVSARVDAIEQQVGQEVDELESDLADLDTFVRGASSFQIATDLTATLISGYKIDTNGYAVGAVVNMTPSAFPGYAYAVYPIKAGQTFVVSGIGGNGPRLWCLVDVDYKFIDQATAEGKTREPVTASVDGYIIYNTQPSSSTYPPFLLRFDYDITTQKYRDQAGPIASQNGNYYTDPIYLPKGATIAVNAETSSTNYALVSKVSESGEYISTLLQSSLSGVHQTITLSETCYISTSSSYSHATGFVITDVSLEQKVDDLAVDVETVSPAADTKIPAINDNPLATIRRDAGYGSIIRKWGIIGDSLSSGEMQCYNEESTSSSDYKFIDMYQYSTGQVLARLLGAEAYNFSNGGQTTWGWLKSQGVVRDETYIGGVGGGDWRLAQQPEYIKDGYIIALGVNDRSKINDNDYELGTTSQITTYDGTDSDIDDTTTYPKSFVRYYAGIIQRILSVQPKAKIFCVTPLGDNYSEIAQAIRDIVTYFGGNVYLMDIRTYIPDGYDVAGFKLQGHLSPMGYAYWAYMYNTYIDWIIRNNGSAFRDTALIGTDYRPDYS